jgi:hypothetical protein
VNQRAVKFLRAGGARLETARMLMHSLQKYLDAQYLAGYAAECALKAILFARTPEQQHSQLEEEICRGRLAHNVEWLVERLIQRCGENVPSEVRVLIRRIRSRWDVDLRYEPGRGNRDVCDELIDFSEQLLVWVKGRIQ